MRRVALTALLAAQLAGAGCTGKDAPATPALPAGQRPNVLLLVMDTARADRCSVYGYARRTTPALEAIAKEGVLFRDAWGPAGWTGPAHGTLFTGLRPHSNGFLEGNRDFLAPEALTLAEVLSAAGYRTAAFTNNEVVSPEYGLTQGFSKVETYYDRPRRTRPPARATHEDALAWARRAHATGEPFFLFINDVEPHLPYDPLEELVAAWLPPALPPEELAYARQFNNPRSDGYNMGMLPLEASFIELLSDLYDGDMATLDAEIGTLVQGLSESGILDSTLLIITSDHGENLGDHGLLDHKWSLHRSILHVPLLLRLPGRFDGGREVTGTVRLEDLFPTVLEAVGIALPERLDGVPLTRDLEGRIVRSSWGTWMHFLGSIKQHYPEVDPTRLGLSIESVYDGRWHYLHRADGVEELYDLASDPQEKTNLAAIRREEVARLKPLLEKQSPPLPVAGSPPR